MESVTASHISDAKLTLLRKKSLIRMFYPNMALLQASRKQKVIRETEHRVGQKTSGGGRVAMDIKAAGDTLAPSIAAQSPRGTTESAASEERLAVDSETERKEAEEAAASPPPPDGLGRQIDVRA